MIVVRCDHCGSSYAVYATLCGQSVPCRDCGSALTVPTEGAPTLHAPAAALCTQGSAPSTPLQPLQAPSLATSAAAPRGSLPPPLPGLPRLNHAASAPEETTEPEYIPATPADELARAIASRPARPKRLPRRTGVNWERGVGQIVTIVFLVLVVVMSSLRAQRRSERRSVAEAQRRAQSANDRRQADQVELRIRAEQAERQAELRGLQDPRTPDYP